MHRTDKMNTRKILEALQKGEIKLSEAEAQLKGFEDLGHSRVDLEREERNGTPEVIYGGGKTAEQIIDIMVSMEARGQNILATRIEPEGRRRDNPNLPRCDLP
jgi:NCAIR mutase (PurE)-related protein